MDNFALWGFCCFQLAMFQERLPAGIRLRSLLTARKRSDAERRRAIDRAPLDDKDARMRMFQTALDKFSRAVTINECTPAHVIAHEPQSLARMASHTPVLTVRSADGMLIWPALLFKRW